MNKVVAHFSDGRIVKGSTGDFFSAKDRFHVIVANAGGGSVEVRVADLKALFFVQDHEGDPLYVESKVLAPHHAAAGRPIRVEFEDGEVLVGTTTGYQPGRPGFFLEPADPRSNNERCFVVSAAARAIGFL